MCKRPVIYIYVCVCVAKKEQKNQTRGFNYTTRNYSGITLPLRGWDTGKIMAPAAPFIAIDPFEQHNQSYNESATYKEATVNIFLLQDCMCRFISIHPLCILFSRKMTMKENTNT